MMRMFDVLVFTLILFYQTNSISSFESYNVCNENLLAKNTFTYILTNQFKSPMFSFKAVLVIDRDAPFDYYMRQAIDICPKFTGLKVSYFAKLGWFIESVNGVASDFNTDGFFWLIMDTYDQPSQLGISSLIPQNGSIYTVNLTSVKSWLNK